jgi:AraC family transcriptional regulator
MIPDSTFRQEMAGSLCYSGIVTENFPDRRDICIPFSGPGTGGAWMNDQPPIFRSLAIIEERIQERLTVEALAEEIHFSKYHYQRLFREAVGDSVMGYVARRKMVLAAGELADTESTILEVALKYGFDSHEGFTRSFKAYMGVTPREYRKYHLFMQPRKKEKGAMMYSKTTDEVIRELNGLIAEAKDTAAYTQKHGNDVPEVTYYRNFWDFTAQRAENIAKQLQGMLERIGAMAEHPDEISARFLIIKAIEDAVFEVSVTAFQTGLTIARAMPDHREKFEPLCEKYDTLAMHARLKARKIVEFFNELAMLIFQDMRKNAGQKIRQAADAGKAAAEALADPKLPYGYMAEELREIAETFSAVPLEEIRSCWLEDILFRLDTVAFAAEADILRNPSDSELFDGISDFRERVSSALEFFRSLPQEAGVLAETGKEASEGRTKKKMYHDVAMQEGILLFYLKGEIRKLYTHLTAERKAALEAVCDKMEEAMALAYRGAEGAENIDVAALLQKAYDEMVSEARLLGVYGGPVQYLAEEVKAPMQYL